MKFSMQKNLVRISVLAWLGFSPVAVWAVEKPEPEVSQDAYADLVLGSMGGLRPALAKHGVELGLSYRGDIWYAARGPVNRGYNYLDETDLVLDVDGEKAFGVKGNTVQISAFNNAGSRPNGRRLGSIQWTDNMEPNKTDMALYTAWVEQKFLHDYASVLIGLQEMNVEFHVNDMASNFIQPTMQLGQAIAQTGVNGPSTFPATSLGARLKVTPTENTYVQFAALDGLSGDPGDTGGTQIILKGSDGLLLLGEAGYTFNGDNPDALNKVAIGGWHYTRGFDDLEVVDGDGTPLKKTSEGVYGIAGYRFYNDAVNGRSLGALTNVGVADGQTKQTKWSYSLGMVGNGWVPTRPDGEFGVGVSTAHNSRKYMRSQEVAGNAVTHAEANYEFYYRDTLRPGVTLQPDVQYMVNPATSQSKQNALNVGARLGVNF